MKIQIAMFAAARQIVGQGMVEVELADTATIADLKDRLLTTYPDLSGLVSQSVFAVGHEYADAKLRLAEGAEVALIPPVSGG